MKIIDILTSNMDDLHRRFVDLYAMAPNAADDIIARYQAMADAGEISEDIPDRSPLGFDLFDAHAPMSVGDALEDIGAEIVGAIESAFFGGIDRGTMAAIAAAVSTAPNGVLTVSAGMDYPPVRALSAWNRCHPDSEPLYLGSDDLP